MYYFYMDLAAHQQFLKPRPLPLALKTSVEKELHGEVAERECNFTGPIFRLGSTGGWFLSLRVMDLHEPVETSKLQSTSTQRWKSTLYH